MSNSHKDVAFPTRFDDGLRRGLKQIGYGAIHHAAARLVGFCDADESDLELRLTAEDSRAGDLFDHIGDRRSTIGAENGVRRDEAFDHRQSLGSLAQPLSQEQPPRIDQIIASEVDYVDWPPAVCKRHLLVLQI